MSSLLRPVGHLPASVYWVRRVLLLAVLGVLVVVLLNLFDGGDPKSSAASTPDQTPRTPGATTAAPSTPTTTPQASGSAESSKQTTTPKDTGCDGGDIRITVLPATRTIASGGTLNLAVRLSALRGECTATIDPTRLSVTITSGNDQIWTTSHCEQAISRATMILAEGKESTSTVAWNGRRSGPGCLPGQPLAKPGTYVAKAVFDGRASVEQAFRIT
ncbi:MAG TPA: hypothetical protein VFT31_06865 [Kribbella sp.]|nr:hypothetical protein [Kribbella sp.]